VLNLKVKFNVKPKLNLEAKARFTKDKFEQNLLWMYYNFFKKVSRHDVGLNLFLQFMCKII